MQQPSQSCGQVQRSSPTSQLPFPQTAAQSTSRNWQPQSHYDPNDKTRLWGAFGYTSDKDVLRTPMKLTTLPWSVDQLTWTFLDMSDRGGTLALMWDRMMASVPFTIGTP